jgi:DNA primase
VATMGASTMTLENAPAWGNLLASKRVRVAMDNDGAGHVAAEKWTVWPFVVAANPLPADTKDITELWQKHGAGCLAGYLLQS